MFTSSLISSLRRIALALTVAIIGAVSLTISDGLVAQDKEQKVFHNFSQDEVDRFKEILPKTYDRLVNRRPLRVVVLGDSNAGGGRSTHFFLDELAKEFFLPGGLHVINQSDAPPASSGAGILLRDLSWPGATCHDSQGQIARGALTGPPNLVILAYGDGDRRQGTAADSFRRILLSAALDVHTAGAELIIAGAPPSAASEVDGNSAEAAGMSRVYTSLAREVAEVSKSAFADLGDLSSGVAGPVKGEDAPAFIERVLESVAGFAPGEEEAGKWWHQLLGSSYLNSLTAGASCPLEVVAPRTYLDWEKKQVVAEFNLRNNSDGLLNCMIGPLPPRAGLIPATPAERFDVGPGEMGFRKIAYDWDGTSNPYPSNEPVKRVPFIVGTQHGVYALDARCEILPFGVEFTRPLQANLASGFSVSGRVVNQVDKGFLGKFNGEWMGKAAEGRLNIPANGTIDYLFQIGLPDDTNLFRARAPLNFTVTGGGQNFNFTRYVEATRNLGLGQRVRLRQPSDEITETAGFEAEEDDAAAAPGVIFRADADEDSLYLVYDISGVNFGSSPEAPAIKLGVFIDARSYGEAPYTSRQTPGLVREVKAFFTSHEDGDGILGPVPIGGFGISYTQALPASGIKAVLSTRPATGDRRVTLTIPRKYFYRHEWALGNGNSQMGIDTVISFQDGKGEGTYPAEQSYSLLPGGGRGDAEALTLLELASPSTGRWSVRFE